MPCWSWSHSTRAGWARETVAKHGIRNRRKEVGMGRGGNGGKSFSVSPALADGLVFNQANVERSSGINQMSEGRHPLFTYFDGTWRYPNRRARFCRTVFTLSSQSKGAFQKVRSNVSLVVSKLDRKRTTPPPIGGVIARPQFCVVGPRLATLSDCLEKRSCAATWDGACGLAKSAQFAPDHSKAFVISTGAVGTARYGIPPWVDHAIGVGILNSIVVGRPGKK